MKNEEIIATAKAEYEKFVSELPPPRVPSFWEPILQKILAPERRFRARLRSFFWSVKMRAKKHYHLHLMLQNEEKHWRVDSIFHSQNRTDKTPKKIEGLFESLPRHLAPLRREMASIVVGQSSDQRKFRGQFAKVAREYRGLSRAQVCRLLNSHRDLMELGRKHPSYWFEFPFTPAFIEKFEEQTETIFEEITQGFLFGAGFPTQDFVRWLSKIYCAEDEFSKFKDWYGDLASKRTES